jgi:hypothetical protein
MLKETELRIEGKTYHLTLGETSESAIHIYLDGAMMKLTLNQAAGLAGWLRNIVESETKIISRLL